MKQRKPCCKDNKQAHLVCLDQNCKQSNPFLCQQSNQHIVCRSLHKKCYKKKWSAYQSQLTEQMNIYNEQFSKVADNTQQILNRCIEQLDKEYQRFKDEVIKQKRQLNIVKFFDNIQQSKQAEWNGRRLGLLFKEIEKKIEVQRLNEIKFNQDDNKIYQLLEEMLKNIRDLYQTLKQSEKNFSEQLMLKSNKVVALTQSEINPKMKKTVSKQQQTVIIKNQYLELVNRKVKAINKPVEHLELLWKKATSWSWTNADNSQLNQLAKALANPNLLKLKTVVIRYPWTVGVTKNRVEAEKKIQNILISLPYLEKVIIYPDDLLSEEGFSRLADKEKLDIKSKQEGWYNRYDW